MERGFVSLNVAVIAIGDALTIADEPPAQLIVDRVTTAGHKLVHQAVVGDFLQAIRAKLLEWIADPGVDVILATAGTRTEYGAAALAPLVTKPLVGFSDLFRYMTFEEIGTAAMLVDADAAQCKSTFVFLLPSSIGAVRTALDRLIIPQLDYRTKPANLVMRLPRIAHVELMEVPEPEPWITSKKPTAQIAGVPAPPKPPPRAGTIPPPLPSVSVVRKIEAVPGFIAKEKTNVGPAPAPRPKISSTISTPLPQRAPAPPAPFVEELEATPPKTREFEVVEKTGPIPRTPSPSVMVDEELSHRVITVKPKTTLPPPVVNTSRPIDELTSDDEGFTTYAPGRKNRKMAIAWASIAIAGAAMLAVFLLMRKPHSDASAAVEPPPLQGEIVASNAPPLAEPPPVEPPPVVVVPDAALVDHEIDMPLESEPVKPPVVAAKTSVVVVAKIPMVAKPPKEPAVEKEPELAPVTTENGCDEVSCALDRYQLACCAKFKPAEVEKPPPAPKSDLPEKIDRAMIVEGVGRMKPAVVRCGEIHGSVKGTVKVVVQVSAGGQVDDISVSSTPDDQLGTCVAAAIKKATFGKTQNGGSFGYPFVF